MPVPLPPDKGKYFDLSSYTTGAQRETAVNNAAASFYATYGVWPTIITIDAVINAVYVAAY